MSERGCLLLQGELAAGAEIRLVKPLTGGRSGARVWLCDIIEPASGSASVDGQYVLKVSSGPLITTGSASDLALGLGTYAETHVPRMLRSATSDDLSVELYDLAGHSLDAVRTAESVSDHLDLDEVHSKLASELLRAQLASGSACSPSSVGSVLEKWLGGSWLEDHRGGRLNTESQALNPQQDDLFRHGAELLPDPVLVAHYFLKVPLDGTLDGICHGDLHERNILVHGSRQTSNLTYWLIDFNWDHRAPLLYDHAYLECSLILGGLERMSNPVLATVLGKIDGVEPAAPAPLDLIASVLVHRIKTIRAATEQELLRTEPRRRDLWRRQIVLARIAAALNWASKAAVDPERARAAYLVAAWNLRSWLRDYDSDEWQALTSPAPRTAALRGDIIPEAEILRLWSTFTLRNTGRDLFIVAGAVPGDIDTSPLAYCDWSAVIDLDPASDISGMASTVIEQLRLRRHVSAFGANIQLTGPRRATNWLMANGWHSHSEATSASREEWRRGYFRQVREVIDVVRDDSLAGSAAILVLQSDETDAAYSRIVEYIDEAYQAAPEVLVLDVGPHASQGVDARSFLETVRNSLLQSTPGGVPTIPGATGPVEIPRADLLRLEVDLEVLHSEKLSDEGEASIADDEFWKGRPPTWGELDAQIDLKRDVYPALRHAVLEALDPPQLTQKSVYHSPGAGGTTLGRRTAWDLHLIYPTVRLRNFTDSTAERIDEIFRLAGKPVLVLAEASDLQPSDRDELFEKLRTRGAAAAVLLITRTAHGGNAGHQLIDPMPLLECRRFIDAHQRPDMSPKASKRLSDLGEQLSDDSPSQYRSPFYIGLCVYDNEFEAIERYVDHHLENLSEAGRQVATYLALVTRYAQFAIPPAVIQRWFGGARPSQLEMNQTLTEVLGPDLRHLVVASSGGARLLHPLIAERVLTSQHGGAQQGLAQISVSFTRELHRALGASSDVARKMLAELFVYRAPISGRDRKGNFAQVIQALTPEGGQLVFETLTDLYPHEPHFWNHRGRYHIYVVKGDFSKAEAHLNNAVKEAGADASLHQHTLGMVRRFWLENEVRDLLKVGGEPINADRLLERIQPLYASAMEAFAQSRTGMTTDHGLVTPLQLLTFIVDALMRASKEPNLPSLLATNTTVADWIAGQIDEAEALLDELRTATLDGRSRHRFYERLTQELDLLYGDIEALVEQWHALKEDRGHESSALGLALARTIFAATGRDWSDVSEARSREIHEMLWEAVSTGTSSDSDLRLWIQAYRRLPEYSETIVLERLSFAAEFGSLDAHYYLYVLNFMRWLRGDVQNQDRARQFLERCQPLARNKNRSWSFEWVGESEPAPTVVHFTELGSQPPGANNFFTRAYLLRRLEGVIERIDGPQAGRIRVIPGTLTAHFRPRLKFLQTRDINATVDFFLGFTYDGLRAYEVEYPGEYRGLARPKASVAQPVAAPIDRSIVPQNIVEPYATVDGDLAAAIAGQRAHPSRRDERLVLDLASCRDAIAGSSGDEAGRRAIENLIKQCESAGARLDSLRLGEALQNVLGLPGYQRLKGGGKLRQAITRLGFITEQGPGAFFVSSEPDGS
ncbi:hypothetical protein GS4_09_00290 [Gordonia soli NBRC 108243]|uniref:Ternary complex associated domain-containing protein n=1 Tax=Gordonia soli NBRC 108243 TaxID=1223545 RepID=M0QGF8_9ACTN|nr:hypothetical protein GS4_09_00290 [Gordonia soli NBRC 108243]